MIFLWVTRGRDWGFRILRDGGSDDPLDLYETVFAEAGADDALLIEVSGHVGLRFRDPEGRRDHAGRPISHEFVFPVGLGGDLASADQGRQFVWPFVAGEYADIWDAPSPPSDHG